MADAGGGTPASMAEMRGAAALGEANMKLTTALGRALISLAICWATPIISVGTAAKTCNKLIWALRDWVMPSYRGNLAIDELGDEVW